MTPSHAVNDLPQLIKRLNDLVGFVAMDAASIQSQWDQLGKLAAQRDDHAAQLLNNLRKPLADLESFCHRCGDQLNKMQADPFGRKGAA